MEVKEVIYNMLVQHDGDSQAVAEAITKGLNAAVSEYNAKSKETEKKKDAETLAAHFNAFTKMYYPELSDTIDAEEIIKMYDISKKITNELSDYMPISSSEWDEFLKKITSKGEKKERSLSDMIAEMGW